MTLMSIMVFKELIGLESPFSGLMGELWEVGRVLTQEWCYLDLAWFTLSSNILTFYTTSNSFIIDSLISKDNFHISDIKISLVYLSSLCMGLFHLQVLYFELNYLHLVGLEATLS